MKDYLHPSEFYKTYAKMRARLAPFRLKEDDETVKTVGIIDMLLNRADDVNAGASVEGRFGFSQGHTLETYMSHATAYLDALERGEFPLAGKFAEPGMNTVDHSFIEKDGVMHLFYNRGTAGYEWDIRFVDTFGHATSADLIHWEIHKPCLSTDIARFGEYQIWSPSVTQRDGKYYMYYTGVNMNMCQGTCLAVSDDLFHWTKIDEEPIMKPGEWCDWTTEKWSDCRDVMVFLDDDTDRTAYMYYCTSLKGLDRASATAVGIASSKDMLHWKDEGAHHFDMCDLTLESPFLLKKDGIYYLFFTNCGHGTCFATAQNAAGPWTYGGLLIGKENAENAANVPSCAEVFKFKGQWYISCAERLPGCEQYVEIFELTWGEDGKPSVGKRLEP